MAKEILLYGDIYGYSADRAVTQLDEAKNSSEVVVRFNGNGGEVRYGWAIIGKAKELKGKKLFKNDGEANSMMAFAFCYNDNNEAFDTSVFRFHRAAYGDNYEASEYFTDSDRQDLIEKNAKLRAAMEAKIDVAAFARITNVTMDMLFAMPGRAECKLNAKQALECKLINRIIPITPALNAQVQALYAPYKIAAKTEPETPIKMDKATLKSQHPDLYAEIYGAAQAEATTKEKERVEAWAHFADVDAKAVKEGIASGKTLTQLQIIEFSEKKVAAKTVKALEAEGAPAVVVAAVEDPKTVTAKEKELKEFNAAMDRQFSARYPNAKRATA